MDAVALDAQRMAADVRWLVEEIGPRPAGSPAEAAAARGVEARLEAAGWSPQAVEHPDNLLACRGSPRRLALAHIDSAPGAPGAVDNAAAVALLLELGRQLRQEGLCLGFPVGEEVGLVGSGWMARSLRGAPLELVISLELLGQGRPALLGLGRAWGDEDLRWLDEVNQDRAQNSYAYRIYSRAMPRAERSDHVHFQGRGFPALLLLGRAEAGAYIGYHQPSDREVELSALVEAGGLLADLLRAPAPPRLEGRGGHGLLLMGLPLPGWLVLLLGLGGGLAAISAPGPLRELRGLLGRGLGWLALAGASSLALLSAGLLPSSAQEDTAARVMGQVPTGWWWGALGVLPAGLAALALVRLRWGGAGSAPHLALLLSLPMLAVDSLLGLTCLFWAGLSRLHPLLCLPPALYLLRPEALRELIFHGLLPTEWAPILWLLALPALGRRGTSAPGAAG